MPFQRWVVLGVMLAGQCAAEAGNSNTDNPRFRHFSLAQGLSQSTVNAILQDRQGFVWFGTQDGLNRFDGYTFTVFRHSLSDSTSLSDNYIWSMVEDDSGDIWVGTLNNGLNRYVRQRGQFSRYTHTAGDPGGLAGNDVTALCRDRHGEILVGTWGGGLQRLDRGTGRFQSLPLRSKLVQCLMEDRLGRIWVGTWEGLQVLDQEGRSLAWYTHDDTNPRSLSGNKIDALFLTADGILWVGTYDAGLDRFDRDDGGFTRFTQSRRGRASLTSNAVRCLGEDRSGLLWIGTADNGIDLFDRTSGTFTAVEPMPSNPDAVSSVRIFSLYRDSTGGIWVGTADAGVDRYDPWAQNFSRTAHIPADPSSLSGNSVRSILVARNGDLWIGTFGGGLNRRIARTNGFEHFRHDPRDPRSIGGDAVLALFEDDSGSLWIGTSDAGLDRLDIARSVFHHYRHRPGDPRSLANDAVMALGGDRSGDVWIGTNGGGLDRFDRRAGSFVHYRSHPGDSTSISGDNVWAIHQDRSGAIWLGTWGRGLNRLDPSRGIFRRYLHDPGNPASISNNTVWSMYEDAEGTLWLGTWGGGLNHLDPRSGGFRSYTEADGLPNNVVYGILPDGNGNLWLSTNKGIARFQPPSGSCKSYDALDGLQGDEFNQGAYCSGRGGELYFGGVNGFSGFFPDRIKVNPYPPAIVLSSFQVFNKPVPLGPIFSGDKTISLSYHDNFISFEFSALSYTIPEKNQYAYKLEGFDNDWVACGTRRYVSYTQLNGGDYVFRVKGSNNDGLWNEQGIAVRIHVEPPFYRRWWFLAGMVALVAAGVYAVYRFQLDKLLEVERLRTRIASDLHDDIGSGLTRIAVLSDVARQQVETIMQGAGLGQRGEGDREGAPSSIRKVGNIARELVDAMSDVVWSIDPRHDAATSLVQRVKAYAFELCEAKNIALTFHAPDAPDVAKLSPEVVRGLLLFAKEAVTNIVRHSQCTSAFIRMQFSRRQIEIEVRDDGSGFDPASVEAGNGLVNMRGRAERAGGVFTVRSAPGQGTTLSIVLPAS